MGPYLKFLDIFVGNKCNLACFQCDTRSDVIRSNDNDPEMQNIKDGIRLAQQKFSVDHYSILGGEPLLYLDKAEEIIKFIRETDKTGTIIIPTNGTLLRKKSKEVKHILSTYNVCLSICNHYAGFEDKTLSNNIWRDSLEFINTIDDLTEVSVKNFIENVFDWHNLKNDPFLKSFLKQRKLDNHIIADNRDNERVFKNTNGWIWIRNQDHFNSHYTLKNNKPKPFMSGSPELSYRNGCCSEFCSFLSDKKLYKCAAMGTLKSFLTHHNSLDDPDWQKYLSYEPLDLETCTDDEVKQFSDTKYSAVSTCDMCPSSSELFLKTKEKVIEIVKI
jgi:organic radical activating enzyme